MTFFKVADETGATTGYVLNAHDQLLPEASFAARYQARRDRLQPELRTELERLPARSRETIRVTIALDVGTVDEVGEPTSGSEAFLTLAEAYSGEPEIRIDGWLASPEILKEFDRNREVRADEHRSAHREAVASKLDVLSRRLRLVGHPAIDAARAEASGLVTIDLTRAEIELLDRDPDGIIVGVELTGELVNSLAQAMKDTNIDPYALTTTGARGQGIGTYLTEGDCPPSGYITNYTQLASSGTTDDHVKNVASILRGVAPDSWVYCRPNGALPTSADLTNLQPRIRVASNSWGRGPYDRQYTAEAAAWDDFAYNNMIATFFAAGNVLGDLNPNGNVVAPGLGLNMLTVGAYDDSTDTIAPWSCAVDPLTKQAKPEFSAPGVGIVAGGITMSGTSQATPHAAAFAADLMSAYVSLVGRPHLLKAKMIAGASDPITGGFGSVGAGGIDFYRSVYNGNSYWWSGGNSALSTWANGDSVPSNNAIDVFYDLNASLSNVRIAISWLNRGTYTYAHRADAHAIGMDFDLQIYDPSGNLVARSNSYDNPFEFVSFDPTVTGKYRFSITRYANRDTASRIDLGMVVDL